MCLEAPLNHGQLWSWRDIDRYPVDWRLDANLPSTWDVRGLRLEDVTRALHQVVRRHEVLRTTYERRAGQLVQQVRPDSVLPIDQVDRVITDPGDPDRVMGRLARMPFGMTGELGWRGELTTTGGAPMFLALSFSHLIVDVWSTQHIRDHFRALAADPRAVLPVGPSPGELALRQRSPQWGTRHEDADRYWKRVMADGLGDCFPTLPYRAEGHRVEAVLRSRRLGGLAAAAARRLGVSVPSVLLGLIGAGLAHHLGTERVPVSVMAANRFTPEHQRVVGTMNQLIPVAVAVEPGAPLGELVKRAHWASTRAYRYSCYDTDRVAAIARDTLGAVDHDCWFNHLFRCWFNFMQLDQVPGDPADPAPAELTWTPLAQPYGQSFRVRIAAEDGGTTVLMLADPDILPRESVTAILRGLGRGVQLAATDPQAAVRSLWDTTGIDPALFPPEPAQTRISTGAG